jgi:hypothetical protein
MVEHAVLNEKMQELVDRAWDIEAINAWFSKLNTEGIPRKTLLKEAIIAGKEEILYRIQRKAEECEFLSHS